MRNLKQRQPIGLSFLMQEDMRHEGRRAEVG